MGSTGYDGIKNVILKLVNNVSCAVAVTICWVQIAQEHYDTMSFQSKGMWGHSGWTE